MQFLSGDYHYGLFQNRQETQLANLACHANSREAINIKMVDILFHYIQFSTNTYSLKKPSKTSLLKQAL